MSGNLLKQWQEFLASLPAGVAVYSLEPQLAIEDEKTPAEWYNGADLTQPPFKPGDKVMLDIEVRKDELWMVREPQVVRELHATPVGDGIEWDLEFEADIPYLVTEKDVRRVP
jgi:hypothetical protein